MSKQHLMGEHTTAKTVTHTNTLHFLLPALFFFPALSSYFFELSHKLPQLQHI